MTEEIHIGAPPTMKEKVAELTAEYTRELGEICDAKVPKVIGNSEYAARTSALMIALVRQTARAAAAFGEAQGQDGDAVGALILALFTKNHIEALQAIEMSKKLERMN